MPPRDTPHARRTLARYLQGVRPGTIVTVDTWRDELEAAELTGQERSGAQRWAATRGYLQPWPMPPGMVACTRTAHRAGDRRLVEVWVRTEQPVGVPQPAPAAHLPNPPEEGTVPEQVEREGTHTMTTPTTAHPRPWLIPVDVPPPPPVHPGVGDWFHLEDARDLAEWGATIGEAARRMGVQPYSLRKRLNTHGAAAVLSQFERNEAC